MNTSKQPVSPQISQPDELENQEPLEPPDKSMVSLIVHTVSGDIIRKVGRVEREMELEEETRGLFERARKLTQEADHWSSKLNDDADQQISYAEGRYQRAGCQNLDDSIGFNREKNNIRKWQREDGRQEFIGTALGKLLEALEMIRGRGTKEVRTLQDELVAKFSSLLNEYKRASMRYGPYGQLIGGRDAHHEFLVKFLKIACGFHTEEGLPVGLEKNAADGINTLMTYNDWEGSLDKGMDLLELVCPFYSTSPTGQKMFAVIMGHLDGLMKMDIESWLTAPSSLRWKREFPDVIKKEEKEWKDCYQKACDDILCRNKLPKHKFKREGGGFAVGNHWG